MHAPETATPPKNTSPDTKCPLSGLPIVKSCKQVEQCPYHICSRGRKPYLPLLGLKTALEIYCQKCHVQNEELYLQKKRQQKNQPGIDTIP
jgi:hypothetical protein